MAMRFWSGVHGRQLQAKTPHWQQSFAAVPAWGLGVGVHVRDTSLAAELRCRAPAKFGVNGQSLE